ncbi:MAG: phage minor capsid protein, partial [Christensenellaceae bacterium]
MKRKNTEGITYEGRHYTGYEATQMQRQIERSIRKTKRELIGFDKAGLKDDFMTSSIKLRRQREYYDDFSNKAGLVKQNERAQVSGYGRSLSGKAVKEA